MKKEILELRKKGKTYNEIKEILGCSKGTIAFHCGEGQKEKSYLRNKKNRNNFINYINKRIYFFQKRDNRKFDKTREKTFNTEDFLNKFGIKTKCALSGIEINLETDRNWDLDHIIPNSKGGDGSLENCQILLSSINRMKGDLIQDELIKYCKLIVDNNVVLSR